MHVGRVMMPACMQRNLLVFWLAQQPKGSTLGELQAAGTTVYFRDGGLGP